MPSKSSSVRVVSFKELLVGHLALTSDVDGCRIIPEHVYEKHDIIDFNKMVVCSTATEFLHRELVSASFTTITESGKVSEWLKRDPKHTMMIFDEPDHVVKLRAKLLLLYKRLSGDKWKCDRNVVYTVMLRNPFHLSAEDMEYCNRLWHKSK